MPDFYIWDWFAIHDSIDIISFVIGLVATKCLGIRAIENFCMKKRSNTRQKTKKDSKINNQDNKKETQQKPGCKIVILQRILPYISPRICGKFFWGFLLKLQLVLLLYSFYIISSRIWFRYLLKVFLPNIPSGVYFVIFTDFLKNPFKRFVLGNHDL